MSRRVFTALSFHHFASELSTYLGKIQSRISGVRWNKEGQFHLTLHFFSALEDGAVERLKVLYQKKTLAAAPIKLGLEGLGGFPDLKHPRVLWLGVQGQVAEVQALQASLSDDLEREGFPVERRPFHPHVTLGRAKRFALHLPRDLPEIRTHPVRMNEIVLFESLLSSEGPRYEVLGKFPLASVV